MKIYVYNMAKRHNEFIEDVDNLEFGDKISLIDNMMVVYNLTVKSTEGDSIEFSDGSEEKKENLQEHIDDFEEHDDIGIKYRGNQYH
jgi:hypothetical protein